MCWIRVPWRPFSLLLLLLSLCGFKVGDELEARGARYRLVEQLDRGYFSTVWKAENIATGETFALKTFQPEVLSSEDMKSHTQPYFELSKMDYEKAPNLLRYYPPQEVTLNGEKHTVLLSEMASSNVQKMRGAKENNPFSLSPSLTPVERSKRLRNTGQLFKDVMAGVHQNALDGYSHHDINPRNVLFVGDKFKLADFDGRSRLNSRPGSWGAFELEFSAPEYSAGRFDSTLASDYFGAASVAYYTLTGNSPLEDYFLKHAGTRHPSEEEQQDLRRILSQSEEEQEFFRRMLRNKLSRSFFNVGMKVEGEALVVEGEALVKDLLGLLDPVPEERLKHAQSMKQNADVAALLKKAVERDLPKPASGISRRGGPPNKNPTPATTEPGFHGTAPQLPSKHSEAGFADPLPTSKRIVTPASGANAELGHLRAKYVYKGSNSDFTDGDAWLAKWRHGERNIMSEVGQLASFIESLARERIIVSFKPEDLIYDGGRWYLKGLDGSVKTVLSPQAVTGHYAMELMQHWGEHLTKVVGAHAKIRQLPACLDTFRRLGIIPPFPD